jgi:hypothetical protein
MIRDAEKMANTIRSPQLRDAVLVASAQRIEHYEIAVYGSLATWAKQLGLDEDLTLLDILNQENRWTKSAPASRRRKSTPPQPRNRPTMPAIPPNRGSRYRLHMTLFRVVAGSKRAGQKSLSG